MNMDLKKLVTFREILGKICLLAAIIAFTGVLDGLVSSFRKPSEMIDITIGGSADINGRLFGNAKTISDLTVERSSSDISIDFDSQLYSGFWFGEGMWRGRLITSGNLKPGNYRLSINYPGLDNMKPKDREKIAGMSSFSITVYENAEALQAASASVITRNTGVSPWIVFAVFFPFILAGGAVNYRISSIMEKLMAENGQAEIYRISKVERGFEVYFGLGSRHGLQSGEVIDLLDNKGQYLARIAVENTGFENSTALVGVYREVKPGYMVSRCMS